MGQSSMKAKKKPTIPVIMYADAFQEQEGIRTLQSLITHTPNAEWNICLLGDKHACKWIRRSMHKRGIRSGYEDRTAALHKLLYRYPQVVSLRPGLEIACDLLPLLDTLWEDREDDWCIAAVPLMRSYVMQRYLQKRGFDEGQDYYNTGFMVIHTEGFLRRLDELAECHRNLFGVYSLEDCLNRVYRGCFKALELSWNYPTAPQQADTRNRFLIHTDMQRYQTCSCRWIVDQAGYPSPLADGGVVQASGHQRGHMFSIITPVYKDSKNIEELFSNLLKQTSDFRQMVQLILIDDGTEGDTAAICEEYRARYPHNILHLQQGHRDPLQARNAAVQYADGKILLFLDVEDRLSEGCLEIVGSLMDRCPQMQIACIPVQHGKGDGKERYLQPTSAQGWVDLECDYGLYFEGVSGVFFRRAETPEYFDESLPMWEAEWRYLAERLKGCRRIGYAPNVRWQSWERDLPAEDMVSFQQYYGRFWMNELDDWIAEQKWIPYWVQLSFMRAMMKCFDNAGTGWDTGRMWEILSLPLNRIEDSVVIDALGMHDMSRILHVLEHKYHCRTEVVPVSGDAQLVCGNTIVGMLSYQAVVLHFITIQDGMLILEGETALPTAVGRNHIHIGLDVNGSLYEGEFIGRTVDKTLLGLAYEYNRTFRFVYRLSGDELIIRFYTGIGEQRVYYSNITCLRFAPISNEVPEGYAAWKGRILKVRGDKLFCMPAAGDAIDHQEHRYQQVLAGLDTPEARRAVYLRRHYGYFQARKHRQIWLFFDRIDKADDNGEALFRYVTGQRNPDIDAYYIIDNKAEDYKRLQSVGRVVAANSASHQLLLLLADYIFTSQANGFVENPFGSGERFYRDLYHRPKVIFLQHGITKDDQTRQFNRFNQNFYALITSSRAETDSIMKYPYYYEDTSIWFTGMPRFDRLYHDERRYLLIMPTWRKQLMEQRWDPELKVFRWRTKEGFQESMYCRNYSSLLNHKGLREACSRYGYQMVFMPHPLVQPYVEQFDIPEDVLVMPYETSWRDLFAWCDLLITDYSSVAFDLAYLKKPLIYYHFDRQDFFAGHTYVEGYFDYRTDGFGEIAEREEELVSLIMEYMTENCRLKEKYRERIQRFYGNLDQKCCERVYQRVLERQNTVECGYGNV